MSEPTLAELTRELNETKAKLERLEGRYTFYRIGFWVLMVVYIVGQSIALRLLMPP